VRRELSANDLQLDDSLTSGSSATVSEVMFEMIEHFSERFYVDCSEIDWLKYFPTVGVPFLPNFMLPARLKTSHIPPAQLTARMLAESAKAGRWLYDCMK